MPLETKSSNDYTADGVKHYSANFTDEQRKSNSEYLKDEIQKSSDGMHRAIKAANSDDYKRHADDLEYWYKNLLRLEAKQGPTEERAPNILKQAGEQFNNLKS